jgi:hypothetical protein
MNKKILKLELYSTLLKIPYEKLTDSEINIMQGLAIDDDVREVMDAAIEKATGIKID